MSDIKIEKGVPIPNPKSNNKYPWKGMEIGDSFFVPVANPEDLTKRQQSISGAARGMKVVTRREPGGVRCWRIA